MLTFTTSSPAAIAPKDLVQDNRASTPQICLIGPSDEATQEAKRWLSDLFKSTGRVKIYNNFLTKFGEQEFVQLCSQNKDGVSIIPLVQRGRPIIIVDGDSIKAAVARIQVESTLCKVQRELIKEEQLAIRKLLSRNVDFKRELIDHDTPEFSRRKSKFSYDGLKMLKVSTCKCNKHMVDLLLKRPCLFVDATVDRQAVYQWTYPCLLL